MSGRAITKNALLSLSYKEVKAAIFVAGISTELGSFTSPPWGVTQAGTGLAAKWKSGGASAESENGRRSPPNCHTHVASNSTIQGAGIGPIWRESRLTRSQPSSAPSTHRRSCSVIRQTEPASGVARPVEDADAVSTKTTTVTNLRTRRIPMPHRVQN